MMLDPKPHLVNGTRFDTPRLRELLQGPANETRGDTQFRRLPRERWLPCDATCLGSCVCSACKPEIGPRAPAYWDTLASAMVGRDLRTWTVHYPELEAQVADEEA